MARCLSSNGSRAAVPKRRRRVRDAACRARRLAKCDRPRAGFTAAAAVTSGSFARSRPTANGGSRRKDVMRILVLDDEPAVCDVVADILRSRGFDVAVACQGEEAVATLERGDRF